MRPIRFRLPQPISIDAIKFHNDGVSPTRNNRSGLKQQYADLISDFVKDVRKALE